MCQYSDCKWWGETESLFFFHRKEMNKINVKNARKEKYQTTILSVSTDLVNADENSFHSITPHEIYHRMIVSIVDRQLPSASTIKHKNRSIRSIHKIFTATFITINARQFPSALLAFCHGGKLFSTCHVFYFN